jgi:hypothetical protein
MAPDEKEQAAEAIQRNASRAGLVAALFMILLAALAVFAAINLWPLFAASTVSAPNANVLGGQSRDR